MPKNIKNIVIIIIGCLFVVQPILLEHIKIFSYLDEFVVIAMLLYFIKCIIIDKKQIDKSLLLIMLLGLATVAIGIIGNILNKYQNNPIPIIWDIFNTFKVFIALLGSYYFIDDSYDKNMIVDFIAKFIRVIIACAFICWVITLFKDIGMNVSEIRYGLKSYNFIFLNAGLFAMYLNLYLFILTIDLKNNSYSKKKIVFILITLFLMATTLRTRSYAYILLYAFMLVRIAVIREFKLKWYHVIMGIIIAAIIGKSSLELYFKNNNTARSTFATTSVELMKKEFPIGTGFATYGTDVAFRYYSNIYYKYHFEAVHGLSPSDGGFSHDTFWPAIIGQFGFLGLIVYLIMLFLVFKFIYQKWFIEEQHNKYNYLAIIFLIFVTCVSSIATSVFFHFSTVGIFFIIPLLSEKNRKENIKEELKEDANKLVKDNQNIVGLCIKYYHENYGGMLQAFATTKMLEQRNIKYEIIRYKKQKNIYFYIKAVPRIFNRILINDKYEKIQKKISMKKHPEISNDEKIRMEAFYKFKTDKFDKKLSKVYFGYKELCEGSSNYKAIITGSDQLWSPAGLPTNFYNLKFVRNGVRKISYASSFGVNYIPWYQKKRTKDYLNRIDFISMRENEGKAIIKEIAKKDVPIVLDPVFMFNEKEWEKLIPVKKMYDEKYVFAYFLGANIEHRKVVEEYARKKSLKIVTLRHLDQFVEYDEKFGDYAPYNISPADFLNLIRGAECICTDSYHGSVLSIIHRKKFIVFDRYNEKSKHSKNSRIKTLCDNFHIRDCRYNGNINEMLNKEINYKDVEIQYKKLKKDSDKYLNDALEGLND